MLSRHNRILYSRLVREIDDKNRNNDCGDGSTRILRYCGSVAFITSSIVIASTFKNLDSSSVVLARRDLSPFDRRSNTYIAAPCGLLLFLDLTTAYKLAKFGIIGRTELAVFRHNGHEYSINSFAKLTSKIMERLTRKKKQN